MEIKTTNEIVGDMDYSGGINWNKMLAPEHEDWEKRWVAVNSLIRMLNDYFSLPQAHSEYQKGFRDAIKITKTELLLILQKELEKKEDKSE